MHKFLESSCQNFADDFVGAAYEMYVFGDDFDMLSSFFDLFSLLANFIYGYTVHLNIVKWST